MTKSKEEIDRLNEIAPPCKCGCEGKVKYWKNNHKYALFIKGHWRKNKPENIEELNKNAPLCNCGCGNKVIFSKSAHKYNKYIHNHQTKNKTFLELYGEEKANKMKDGFSGKNNPFYGKKHTEETKLIISNNNTGRIVSEEEKNNQRMASIKFFKSIAGEELKKKWSLNRSLEKNNQWLGGKSFEPYDTSFNLKFKNSIRQRDNQICMDCGIHKERLKHALDVHHIDYDKLNSIPQNCIALCKSCHTKTNFQREDKIKYFQSKLSRLYGYKYTIDNKIIIDLNIGDNNV